MKKRSIILCAGAAAGMLMLILDGRTAAAGVREGIDLCVQTLVPALFPFFVLSALLTGTLIGRPIPMLRPLGRLCGIPTGAEFLLAAGFLGGYPVGAQNVGQACREGCLSESEAERLLALCNNAGPSVLFGMIAPVFTERSAAWILWGLHILSALLTGMLTAEPVTHTAYLPDAKDITFPEALTRAVRSIAMVCGWVLFFRMILEFLSRWVLWLLPTEAQVLLCGMLELSNGCVRLSGVGLEGLRFLLAGVMLALGGACVTMQTASVAAGLSLRRYLSGKMLQSCISFWLCMLAQMQFPAERRVQCSGPVFCGMMVLTGILLLLPGRNKKISSIPVTSGV